MKPVCRGQDANPFPVDGKTSIRVTMHAWKYFAGAPPLALVRYVISRAATQSKMGKRRQLMVLDAKRAFPHADALTETYVKPPHLRDTERCRILKTCMYGTLLAAAGWQHLVRRVGTEIGLMCIRTLVARFWTWPCMVTTSSSLEMATTLIGYRRS